MSYVFIGLGFMAFLSASILAIDVGMLMTARNQAQNSADAGALGGAVALAFDDYEDRSPTGPAVTSAINSALANKVMSVDVSVIPTDVVFLNDELGQPNRVKVTVYRNDARDNPLGLLMAAYLKIRETADIAATATAEVSPADAMTCVKPFTIPDRWKEMQDAEFDPNNSAFDAIDDKGVPVGTPDVYIGPEDEDNYTGYNAEAEKDKGLQIVLKANNDSKISPSFYYPWDMPGENSGADDYRWNIGQCNTTVLGFGDEFVAKPGNMVGPTKQGMDDLINKDPDAYWDESKKEVVSKYKPSPRVVAIPLFDPEFYEMGKHEGKNASLKFVNYLGFFIEKMQGNEVVGRITPIGGLRQGNGPAPAGAIPKAIRLVK
jgi:hypothetical protein